LNSVNDTRVWPGRVELSCGADARVRSAMTAMSSTPPARARDRGPCATPRRRTRLPAWRSRPC